MYNLGINWFAVFRILKAMEELFLELLQSKKSAFCTNHLIMSFINFRYFSKLVFCYFVSGLMVCHSSIAPS